MCVYVYVCDRLCINMGYILLNFNVWKHNGVGRINQLQNKLQSNSIRNIVSIDCKSLQLELLKINDSHCYGGY